MESESRSKILIIDDSKTERQNLKRILNDTEYIVYEADNGQLGISFATQFEPDLILCDVIMPGIDGYITCKRLKELEETKHIPVIFVTGQSDLQNRVTGFQVGGIDYITKPYEPIEVLLRIRNHLSLVYSGRSLKRMNHQLKNLLEMQTKNLIKAERQTVFAQFIQGVVHNLKAPLSAISGYAEINNVIIEGDELSSSKSMLLRNNRIIKESCTKVVDIVNSLLKRGRENMYEQKVHININKLINEELNFLEANMFYKTKVKKIINLYSEDLISHVIPSMISQSLQNLVKNAIDAMFYIDNPVLEISTSCRNNRVLIKISDNGTGIPEENLEKIFDPFYSTKPDSDPDNENAPTGTGLGLFICKEMIEANKGHVSLTSVVNQGTTFIIDLPLSHE
jgi:signal transduction histidine kinase